LPADGKGALRRAAAEARRSAAPADPARLPAPHRRRPPREEPRVGESRQRGLTATAPAATPLPRARQLRAGFAARSRRVTFIGAMRQAAEPATGRTVGRRIIERPRLIKLL